MGQRQFPRRTEVFLSFVLVVILFLELRSRIVYVIVSFQVLSEHTHTFMHACTNILLSPSLYSKKTFTEESHLGHLQF